MGLFLFAAESSDARVTTFATPNPVRYANAITVPLSLQRAEDEKERERERLA